MGNKQFTIIVVFALIVAALAISPSINMPRAFTPSPNQTMEPSSQIPDITAPQVEISNFSGGPPEAFTFTNAGILFRLTISNVGNYAIQNLVLKVNLTLADGETPDEIEIPSISNPLQAGQSEQLSGAAVFGQYYMNIMGVQQYWSITVETSLSNLVLAQKTFEYPPPPAPTPETYSQHLLGQILVESPQNGATVGTNSTIHFSFQIPDAIVARVGTAKAGNYLLNGRAYNSTLLLDFCMFAGCTFDTPSQQIYDNVYFNNNHLDTWGASYLYQNNTVLSYQGGDVYNGTAQIPFSSGTHTFEIWVSAEQNLMSFFDDEWTGFSQTITFTVDAVPPQVLIFSPSSYFVYNSDVALTFTVAKPTSQIGYVLDGNTQNASGNLTLHGLTNGVHSIQVYAYDTSGNLGRSVTVNFTVEQPSPTPTTATPTLSPSASVPEFPTWTAIAMVSVLTLAFAGLKKRTSAKSSLKPSQP